MTDQLEQSLREALSYRDAQLDPDSIARLRAVDYHPRQRRIGRLPAHRRTRRHRHRCGDRRDRDARLERCAGIRRLEVDADHPGAADSSPRPRRPVGRGWEPGSDRLARSVHGRDLRRVEHERRLPQRQRRLDVVQHHLDSDRSASRAGRIQFAGGGTRDSAGDALTLADGRIGAGVTAVTFELSDGSSVQATVAGGWYLAWWPGTVTATKAQVTTASGTSTVAFRRRLLCGCRTARPGPTARAATRLVAVVEARAAAVASAPAARATPSGR